MGDLVYALKESMVDGVFGMCIRAIPGVVRL